MLVGHCDFMYFVFVIIIFKQHCLWKKTKHNNKTLNVKQINEKVCLDYLCGSTVIITAHNNGVSAVFSF